MMQNQVLSVQSQRYGQDDFQAAWQFDHQYAGSIRHRLWSKITHHDAHLLNLTEVEHKVAIKSRHDGGYQSVPVRQIVGSEGRSDEFTEDFRPLQKNTQSRWISVAKAHEVGVNLPPVELVKMGKAYFVRDGNHRVSVAKGYGQSEIDAHVTVWDISKEQSFDEPELAAVYELPTEN